MEWELGGRETYTADPETAKAVAKPTETRCFSGGSNLVIIRIPCLTSINTPFKTNHYNKERENSQTA